MPSRGGAARCHVDLPGEAVVSLTSIMLMAPMMQVLTSSRELSTYYRLRHLPLRYRFGARIGHVSRAYLERMDAILTVADVDSGLSRLELEQEAIQGEAEGVLLTLASAVGSIGLWRTMARSRSPLVVVASHWGDVVEANAQGAFEPTRIRWHSRAGCYCNSPIPRRKNRHRHV